MNTIITRFAGLDENCRVVILTDTAMGETAWRIQAEGAAWVKSIQVFNLDEENDDSVIYSLAPEDLLILHIGIESWIGKHRNMAHAFDKPAGVAAKYICIRPTVTAEALLEGISTPKDVTEGIVHAYGGFTTGQRVRVTAESGTDLSLVVNHGWTIPYSACEPGANAYLPPAEISYEVEPHSTNGIIVADISVGELRVYADLVDPFGLVDEPVTLHIQNGEITDISGGDMARRLKTALWKLPETCRKVVELGIGLSRMTPSGIIGIDESIAGTCHFGFGNGSGNEAPIHLDVVVNAFSISY